MSNTFSDWQELVERARRGAEDAWGVLLDGQRQHLLLLAGQRLRGRVTVRVEAADIVQQTFLDAHRAFDQFTGREEAAFRAWLERILEHEVARALRDNLVLQKRSMQREQPLEAPGQGSTPGPDVAAGHTTPSQRAIRNEDEERLVHALENLPEAQREAVRLRHLEGWSLAAIAEHLGRTTVATAALVKRGMEALRKHLNEEAAQ